MIVYFDTSALVKLVFDEDGSDVASELWDLSETAVSCQLVYPEARAAIAAAHRAQRIDARTLRAAVRRIDQLYEELDVVGVDGALARAAGALAEQHGLRGYDAVHLACTHAVEGADVVVATWDRELARAAVASGRAVVPAP